MSREEIRAHAITAGMNGQAKTPPKEVEPSQHWLWLHFYEVGEQAKAVALS